MATSMADLGFNIDSSPMRRATRDLDRMSKESGRAEKSASSLVAVTKNLGIALAGLGAARAIQGTIKSFADFERGLIAVSKTTNISGNDLKDLGSEIRELTRTLPVASSELLAIAQSAGQLGVTGSANIIRFSETVGKLGLASNLAGDSAATSLARILTVTGTSISEVDRLGSTIVRLGNNFAATESEIAAVATRVAQSTSQFNVSAAEVAGISTAIRAVGVEAESGGTQVGLAFQAINDALREGGSEMETLQRITGQTGEALSEAFFNGQSAAVFSQLVEGLGEIQRAGGDLNSALSDLGIEGVRAVQVLGTLAARSEVLADAVGQANSEWDENLALTREAAVAATSFSAQLDLASNSLDEASAAIGALIAPAALDAIDAFRDGAMAIPDNIETLEATVESAGLVIGVVLANQLRAAGAAAMAKQAAITSSAAATAKAAQTEIGFLRAVQGSLSSQLASATTASQSIAIRSQLTANTAALTSAQNAYNTALARGTIAARTTTAAMAGLRSTMAFFGGPVGVAIIAAGSIYAFREELGLTSPAAMTAAEAIDNVTDAMRGMNREEQVGFLENMQRNLAEAEAEAERLSAKLEKIDVPGNQGGRAGNIIGALKRDLAEANQEVEVFGAQVKTAEGELKKFDQSREQSEQGLRTLSETSESAADRVKRLAEAYDDLIQKLDPAKAAQNDYFETIEKINKLDVSRREKDRLEALAFEKHWKQMAEIAADGAEKANKKAKEEFENPWQDTAERVAQSLQDAIASGDWDQIGDVIGNTLATSISGIVSQTITDRLSKDLTSDSSTLAQIGGAFAGPIAGAVAGGAIQLAVSELSDFFSGSDWDPTEDRQASQGTGSVLGSIDAKSESIANATDITASTNEQLVGINTGMLRSLQNLQIDIAGATAMIARGQSGTNFSTSNRFSQSQQAMMGLGAASPAGLLGSLAQSAQLGAQVGSVIGGSILGPVGSLTGGLMGLGKGMELFGDAVDFVDDLTGGLLSDLGSSLFGGDQEIKDIGIELFGATLDEMIAGIREGDRRFTAQAFASIEEDGGLFGDDNRFDKYAMLSAEASQQISLVFAGIQDSVTAGAEALGLSSNQIQSALDQFQVETQKISLEDLNAEEQAAALESVFSKILDQAAGAVVPFIDDLQRAGEGLGETLARTASQVGLLEESITTFGSEFSFYFSPEGMAKAADNISRLVGGTEAFASAITGLESNFMSESERLEALTRRLGEAMGDLPLPETRDGFLQLVQGQDLITAGGQENYATLLRLQGAADQYYSLLESVAEDAAAAAKDAAAAAERAAERARKALMDLTDDALVDLQRSVEAERARATESYEAERDAISQATDARLEANQLAIDAARSGVQAIQQEVQGLESALDSLRDAFDPMQAMRRAGALDLLREALSSGDLTGTGEAAGIASQIDSAGFATRADFQREQGRTLNLLSALEDEGVQQLSTAEQSLESLEDQTRVIRMSGDAQLAALEKGYSEEMQRLDGILSNAEQQVNALRGIDNSVMDLSSAIHALAARLGAEEIGPNEGGASASQIESLYASIGRDPSSVTGAEIDFWEQTGITGDALRQAFLEAAATYVNDPELRQYAMNARGQLGLPQFADGGIASGPSSGYMAELHGREAVIPLSGGAIPLKMMGGDKELLAEMRKMREELLAANRALVKSNEKQRELLQRWDQNGLPEERTFV